VCVPFWKPFGLARQRFFTMAIDQLQCKSSKKTKTSSRSAGSGGKAVDFFDDVDPRAVAVLVAGVETSSGRRCSRSPVPWRWWQELSMPWRLSRFCSTLVWYTPTKTTTKQQRNNPVTSSRSRSSHFVFERNKSLFNNNNNNVQHSYLSLFTTTTKKTII